MARPQPDSESPSQGDTLSSSVNCVNASRDLAAGRTTKNIALDATDATIQVNSAFPNVRIDAHQRIFSSQRNHLSLLFPASVLGLVVVCGLAIQALCSRWDDHEK